MLLGANIPPMVVNRRDMLDKAEISDEPASILCSASSVGAKDGGRIVSSSSGLSDSTITLEL